MNELHNLLDQAKKGNEEAMDLLMQRYTGLVRKNANGLFLIGADRDDLLQEGMIGLFKAVMSFDQNKEASFDTYANICISRQMISAIKGANRYKHKLLNEYISIYKREYEEEDMEISEKISDDQYNPEIIITQRESLDTRKNSISGILSPLERSVFKMLIEGYSNQYMADNLKKDLKSIDNTIQRIKRKVRKVLEDEH